MKLKGLITAIALIILVSVRLYSAAGRTGAQILRVEPTARAYAMGDAFTAIGDDVNGLFYNPACLNYILDRQFLFSHIAGFDNFKYDDRLKAEYLAYAQPIGKMGAVGGYIYYFGATQPRYEIDDKTPVTQGEYRDYDLILSVGYGRPLPDILPQWLSKLYGVFAGANLKIIREKLADYGVLGIALDLGALYTLPEGYGTLGIAIKNIGFSFDKFVAERLHMPFLIRVGLNYNSFPWEILKNKLTGAVDLEMNPSTNSIFGLMLGAEYNYNNMFFPRIGYRLSGNILGFDGLSMGLGVKYKWNQYLLNIDYGMRFEGIFGIGHRLTIGLNF